MNGDDELVVSIRGLEAYGRHGVYAARARARAALRRRHRHPALRRRARPRPTTWPSRPTTATLAAAVAEIVGGEPVALLERLASLIADRVLAEPRAPLRRGDGPQAPRRAAAGRHRDLRHPPPARVSRYWLGLGGNLGDPAATIAAAIRWLGARHEVEAVSRLYDTSPARPRRPARPSATRPRGVRADLDAARDARTRPRRSRPSWGATPGGVRFGPRVIDCDLLLWDGGRLRRRAARDPASAPGRAPLRAAAAARPGPGPRAFPTGGAWPTWRPRWTRSSRGPTRWLSYDPQPSERQEARHVPHR